MAKQVINIGTVANDRTGDTWRDAMDKSNDNFTELFDFDASLGFVFIAQESDFPVQDATTITLQSDTVHIVTASFTTAKKFIVNDGAVLTMDNQFGPVLTYSGTGSMFTGTDAFFTIRDMSISCASAQAFAFTDTVANVSVFLAINLSINVCSKVGTFTDIRALDLSGSNSLASGDGITIANSAMLLVSIRQFAIASASPTFKAIDLGSSVISNIEASNLIVIAPAGAFGISGIASSGNVPVGSLAMVRDSSFIGGVTDLENITTDDIRWSFRDNSPTKDTQEDALLSFRNNATETVITTINTPVIVNATWVEQRASFFTTTAAGRATYNGERNLTAPITISAGLISAGGGAIDVTLYVAINGAVDTASGVKISISGSNAQTLSIPWQDELSLTDFVEVFVENNTNTTNIIVEYGTQRIR